ncbi:MAG: hypothetical protein MSB12_01815 [Lentisphaeraceae bacterium]|nr:hypothetical protein [Lentisphaeraceae bacterium]
MASTIHTPGPKRPAARSTTSPRPRIRTNPSSTNCATSDPNSAPSSHNRSRATPSAHSSFTPRNTVAAFELPPPSPPPNGIRLRISSRVGSERPTSRSNSRTARTAKFCSASAGIAPNSTPSPTTESVVSAARASVTASHNPTGTTTESNA